MLDGALALVRTAVHVVRHFLALHELHGRKVEDKHVVELLGELKDATEDIHFVVICNGCVTTSGKRAKISLLNLNFSPCALLSVKLPEVIELVIIVVLASENVEFAVKEGRGGRGTWLGALISTLLRFANGGLDRLVAWYVKSA